MRCPLKKAARRENEARRLLEKNTRIREEQGDSDWQREGAKLAQTRTMGE